MPRDWAVTYLGHAVDVVGGATPSKENLEFWDGDLPWVSPKDMKREVISDSEDHISETALKATSLRLIPPPAVLMVTRGLILDRTVPVALTAGPVTVNQDMKALLPRRGLSAPFLAYSLRASHEALLSRVEEAGHGTKALRTELWRKLPIAIPPPKVQRAIAAFLDRKTAAIDALIAKKERQIDLLQEKRQALVTHSVTRGLDPSVRVRSVEIPWAKEIPAHWAVTRVKRTAARVGDSFTDGDWIEAPFITDDGVRLLQTGNVGTGFFKEQGFRYVSEATFHQLRCKEVRAGDVLICRLDGPVGRACLAPDLGCRTITSVDNAILHPSDAFDPGFLVYALSARPYLEWVQALCRVGGGHRFRISRNMLGDFPLPAPPLDEQVAIRSRLDQACRELDRVVAIIGEQIDRLREYRQALISAAVTGKIEIPVEGAA